MCPLKLDRIHVYVLRFSTTTWEWSLWTRTWSRMEDFIWRGFRSVCCSSVWGCLAGVHHHRGVSSSVSSACASCVDHTHFYPHLHREGGVSSHGERLWVSNVLWWGCMPPSWLALVSRITCSGVCVILLLVSLPDPECSPVKRVWWQYDMLLYLGIM